MSATISRTSTMQQVLQAFPGAQRALFRRYHIGGCSSCGFQPQETLEQVLSRHNVLDVDEAVQHIQKADELDKKIQIQPKAAAELLKAGKIKLIDVRQQFEWDSAHIEGAQLLSQELLQEIMEQWPKDTHIVFHCHRGSRSMDAAAYFLGHGFSNVQSLEGGIDAWSQDVDTAVPRYRM